MNYRYYIHIVFFVRILPCIPFKYVFFLIMIVCIHSCVQG